MSEAKVQFEHLIDEIDLMFVGLRRTIDSSINEVRQLYVSLDESVDKNILDVDYSNEIKKRFAAGEPLSGSLIKYYWANFQSFDLGMLEWCQRSSPLSLGLIERYVIKGWAPRQQREGGSYSVLDQFIGAPRFLPSWQVLDDLKSATDLTDHIVSDFLNDEYSTPRLLQRTLLFRYMVADYCYRNMDESFFVKFVEKIMGSAISSLNFDEMCSKQSFDSASQLMIACLLKYFRNASVGSDQVHLWLNTIKSVLGDPRALGNKWGRIEELEREGYSNWLSTLNEEDILFFFENLEKVIHPERMEFWLRFVRGARRIAVVLDSVQRSKLLRTYQNNEKMLEVINRSYQFNSNGSSSQQLIVLFFNGYVVVEGSNTGFGCQIYREKLFKERFGGSFYETDRTVGSYLIKQSSPGAFAGTNSGREKMLRHAPKSPAWERDFLNYFSTIDIYPDALNVVRPLKPIRFDHKKDSIAIKPSDKFDSKRVEVSTAVVDQELVKKDLTYYLSRLTQYGAEIIDNRPKGPIWIVYEIRLKPLIDEMKKSGFDVRLSQMGGRATMARMAWWIDQIAS